MAENKAIEGRIVNFTTAANGGLTVDSILVSFDFQGKSLSKPFASPPLDGENLLSWRKIVVFAMTGKKPSQTSDEFVTAIPSYNGAIMHKQVFLATDGKEIYALGRDAGNMFFPDAYALFEVEQRPQSGAAGQ